MTAIAKEKPKGLRLCACVYIFLNERIGNISSLGGRDMEVGRHPIKEKSRHEKKEILLRGF